MTVYSFDPLHDPRWTSFVEGHDRASIFHTCGWLDALKSTYGYEPVVYTTTPPGVPLTNGVAFCRVSSWLTGRRVVSVPFADHCDPLVEGSADCAEILEHLTRLTDSDQLRYVEIRPLNRNACPDVPLALSQTFAFHELDLRPSLTELFGRLHKDSIQRKIRRATRDGVQYQAGRSDALLRSFYRMLVLTRRRHRVPPQPFEWFQRLRDSLGNVNVLVALKEGNPIASIFTLRYRKTLLYKYGGSDASHHQSGAMPFLFWRAIEDAHHAGLTAFDLGRSDIDNRGLITFKDRLGAAASPLMYFRYPEAARNRSREGYPIRIARMLVPVLPNAVLSSAGKLLYRHVG